MENIVPAFPLQLIFHRVIVGVKWWVCREAPAFGSEALTQKLVHLLLMLFFSLSVFIGAGIEMSRDSMLSL